MSRYLLKAYYTSQLFSSITTADQRSAGQGAKKHVKSDDNDRAKERMLKAWGIVRHFKEADSFKTVTKIAAKNNLILKREDVNHDVSKILIVATSWI